MLHTLVYVSCATPLCTTEALVDILRHSRANNERLDITGLLLYVDGNFMQGLEGPEAAVLGLYERIRRDLRHKNVKTILSAPVDRRCFPQWSMGFREASALPEAERVGISTFLQEVHGPRAANPADAANFAGKLLDSFAASMR